MKRPVYVYPWPASALTPADMAALHAVRERSAPHVAITDLIAHAVRETYGAVMPKLTVMPAQPARLKAAA